MKETIMTKKTSGTADLGTEKLGKLLFRFATPAIVGLVINSLYYVVDRIFVGNGVGALGLGAISVGYPLTVLQMAVGMMVGVGGSVNFSVRLGQKKTAVAERFLTSSVTLILVFGIMLTAIIAFFLKDILRFLGATETLMPYAETYLYLCLIGAPFYMGGMSLNNLIRSCGAPRYAMGVLLVGAVLNTVLDPIFIFVLDMGIAGAAIATVIAQAVSFSWSVLYFVKFSPFKWRRKYIVPTFGILTAVCSTGMAQFFIQTIGGFVQTLMNRSLVQYGSDIALSAIGISTAMVLFLLMPVIGLCEGAQPITGFNLGAKKYDRVLGIYRLTSVLSSVASVFAWCLLFFFAKQIVRMFAGDDADLLRVGVMTIKTTTLAFPTVGMQIATSLFLQATKKPKTAMLLVLSRQVLFLAPMLLVLPRFFGLRGVFLAMSVSDFIAFLLAVVLMIRQIRLYRGLNNVAT